MFSPRESSMSATSVHLWNALCLASFTIIIPYESIGKAQTQPLRLRMPANTNKTSAIVKRPSLLYMKAVTEINPYFCNLATTDLYSTYGIFIIGSKNHKIFMNNKYFDFFLFIYLFIRSYMEEAQQFHICCALFIVVVVAFVVIIIYFAYWFSFSNYHPRHLW